MFRVEDRARQKARTEQAEARHRVFEGRGQNKDGFLITSERVQGKERARERCHGSRKGKKK
jgi:hypothetical protein